MRRSNPVDRLAKSQLGDLQILYRLRHFLWPPGDTRLKLLLVGAVTLLGGMAAVNAFVPMLFARAVDALSAENAVLAAPFALLIAYGALYWLAKIMSEARWLLYGPIEQRVQRRVALHAFNHLHGLSLRFHIDRSTGQLARVLDNGTRGVRSLLFDLVFAIMPFVIEIVFVTAVVLFRFEAWYAVILLATLAAFSTALLVGSAILRRRQREAIVEGTIAQGKAIDSLLNYETVKYFGNETYDAARYDTALRRVERLTVRSLFYRSATGIAQVTPIALGLGAMVLLAGTDVAAGRISVGDFVLVNAYLLQLVRPLERLANLYRSIRTELAHVEQLVLLFEVEPEIRDAPGAPDLAKEPAIVSFDKVSFGYDRKRPLLHDLSFSVEPGRMVALVGPTGAGKSTIARLLFRSFEATDGAVRINGSDIRALTQQSVRSAIGVIPQDPVLFNDTIGFNIGFGRPDATQGEIEAAAKQAQLHDFIASLPDGYQTIVGERGIRLSGGEKQRIAIARTILKDPPILVFDEATSSLDLGTEARIWQSLRDLMRSRTTIVIAHRLSTVIDADEILFLSRGRVMERGTHDALLGRNGRYAAMWRAQESRLTAGETTQ